jgi:Tol biopolymer transport system component
VRGGTPQRLTKLGEFSLYPAFSPDGKHIAILAAGGIYLMNPDGSDLKLLTDAAGVGTLDWVP